MRAVVMAVIACVCLTATGVAQKSGPTGSILPTNPNAIIASLSPRTGVVELSSGVATLSIPKGFYFLDREDARRVLVEVWGNPEDQDTWGMILPVGVSPIDADSWAVNVKFLPIGHVSDLEAELIDPDRLLTELQHQTTESNTARVEAGHARVDLLGWTDPPHYRSDTRQLVWGRRLQFEGFEAVTINYEIQTLGRRGTLVMNVVASDAQLPQIRAVAPALMAMPTFNTGHRYEDFDPRTDLSASSGLSGLIVADPSTEDGFAYLAWTFMKRGGLFILIAALALFAFTRLKLGGSRGEI